MDFEYIHKIKRHVLKAHGYYINYPDRFYKFVDEYNIVGVHWGQPKTISASYFLRLLREGSSARARGFGRSNNPNSDEGSEELTPYYHKLLDHGALWRLSDGRVICTAMPYGEIERVVDAFLELRADFSYPKAVRLDILNDEYRFRKNGDCMIVIYYDESNEVMPRDCSLKELREKAVGRTGTGLRQRLSSTFLRDKYIKAYAKMRANGVCQLCGQPAPFQDEKGEPYLEVHHVIWLADGGEDSINNTVALCPNCHRKMHVLNCDEDVDKLLRAARMII